MQHTKRATDKTFGYVGHSAMHKVCGHARRALLSAGSMQAWQLECAHLCSSLLQERVWQRHIAHASPEVKLLARVLVIRANHAELACADNRIAIGRSTAWQHDLLGLIWASSGPHSGLTRASLSLIRFYPDHVLRANRSG